MMMDDLITWLRAQLDDDERAAQAATAGPWRHDDSKHWRKPGTSWFEEAVFAGARGEDATCIAGTGESDDPQSMADATHIAGWDPARVLREVEAKRKIIDEIVPWIEKMDRAELERVRSYFGLADKLLRRLALAYSDRPGYREEWRP